jgi:cytochrome c-type biogenesis protein CcsB
MSPVLQTLILICYGFSAIFFVADRLRPAARLVSFGVFALAAGAILHAVGLTAMGIQSGNFPVADFGEALSFLAWLTALAGLVMIVRSRMAVVGVFLAPAVTVAFAAASIIKFEQLEQSRIVLPETLRSVWLPIHVTLAILGYAMFVLAASVSVVYLAYERRLKAKRILSPLEDGTPSLEKLDRINYQLLGWGFAMLSLAIITGAIWADATWGHFWSWEPVESWSLVIWILYAALIESRLTVGWRGRRAAALTIVVFTVLLGSFIGVNLMYPGKHGGNFG